MTLEGPAAEATDGRAVEIWRAKSRRKRDRGIEVDSCPPFFSG
jgi:hypothetical protein